MGWIEKWFPRTGRCIREGMRLALLNAILLVVGGSAVFLLFEAVYVLRKVGIPIPLPVWLVMVILVIPYYVLMFQYGKVFGRLNYSKNPATGFVVGLLGQLPCVLSLTIAINCELYRHIEPEVWRVLFTMMSMIVVVAPVMVGLGLLDRHDRENVTQNKNIKN